MKLYLSDYKHHANAFNKKKYFYCPDFEFWNDFSSVFFYFMFSGRKGKILIWRNLCLGEIGSYFQNKSILIVNTLSLKVIFGKLWVKRNLNDLRKTLDNEIDFLKNFLISRQMLS